MKNSLSVLKGAYSSVSNTAIHKSLIILVNKAREMRKKEVYSVSQNFISLCYIIENFYLILF